MNAIAPIQAEQLVETTAAEEAHCRAISMHITNEGRDMLLLRARIAVIRDQASAGMRNCSGATYDLLNDISRLAQSWIYAPAKVGDLFLIRCALVGLMDAARTAERVERRKAHGAG